MKSWLAIPIVALGLLQPCCAEDADVIKISLPTSDQITRADLYIWQSSDKSPERVLVLCPGQNGNSKDWVSQQEWQAFAQEQNLGLCGLSFASTDAALAAHQGYFNAGLGSGQLLLDGVRQYYGDETKLLLYGFSGGAIFSASFSEWQPGKVLAFAAHSASWWCPPVASIDSPPGLLSCGEYDATRYWATLNYFQQGRRLGRRWTWLALPKIGHYRSPSLDIFVRLFFSAIINQKQGVENLTPDEFKDIDTKASLDAGSGAATNEFGTWLPGNETACTLEWLRLHSP